MKHEISDEIRELVANCALRKSCAGIHAELCSGISSSVLGRDGCHGRCGYRRDRSTLYDVAEAFLKLTKLSHYDEQGQAHMVDVSAKTATKREARARALVELSPEALAALPENPKGNPLEVARFAGIQAAKQTSTLIPMCHPLTLSFVDVETRIVEDGVAIEATAATIAGTGVEMEAMVAASVAALTIYDMTKALDKGIRIRAVELVSKSGGKSGDWRRG